MAILLAMTGRDSLDVAPDRLPDVLASVLEAKGLALEDYIPPMADSEDLSFDVINGTTAAGESVTVVRSNLELYELANYDGPVTVRTFRVTPAGPRLMTQEVYSPDYMADLQRRMIARGRARLVEEFGAQWYSDVRQRAQRQRAWPVGDA